VSRAHSQASQPKTIDIFVMLTVKPGAKREQIAVMAQEIRPAGMGVS
jgi:hypothetical protein